MSEETRSLLRSIALQVGFDIDHKYADDQTMRDAVRALDHAPENHELTEELRLGLLENLRQVIRKTAATEIKVAIEAQTRLPRWKHLRRASPPSADAYIEVLRYFKVDVPIHLLEED